MREEKGVRAFDLVLLPATLRRVAFFFAFALALGISASPARADEGMWTLDNFPSKTVAQKYGFGPSQAWLDHVQRSTVRLIVVTNGCSGSFISPHGLIMTNQHCVAFCVRQLSTAQQNFEDTGFTAKTQDDERPCPAFEADQLTSIRDVTAAVRRAMAGKTGDAANLALRAETASLQQSCGSDPAVLCSVVSLYQGGVYDLYRYRRYTDLRLVFAPENGIGQFGGDPDNFNFPRYNFDVGLLRVYDNGRPLANADYLRWSAGGSKTGGLTFVPGNPGGTSRELTVAQLAYARDRLYPLNIAVLSEYRGLLEEFATRGPEQARETEDHLPDTENTLKEYVGAQQALLDPQFFALKRQQEQRLRAAVRARPALAAADGSAWDDIARTQRVRGEIGLRVSASNNFFFVSPLLADAITLVRAAEERTKPNGARLPEFSDVALAGVQRRLAAPVPMFKDLETLNLTFIFTIVRRELGPDDPFVHKMLGTESPEQLATRLVSGTQLDDPKVRAQIYSGGQAAIAASTDPLIVFAVAVDPDLRASRKEFETRVDAPTRAASERIANARFAVYGTTVYPDGTFSPRLSYGTVKGFPNQEGRAVAPYTTFAGLYGRAGAPPFDIPQSWLAAKSALDLSTPYNLVSTDDITAGNSGSPLIDKNAQIVGVVFDGNIFSLSGQFGYDALRNRTVSLDSRALLAGWRQVYHFDRIVDEIAAAQN